MVVDAEHEVGADDTVDRVELVADAQHRERGVVDAVRLAADQDARSPELGLAQRSRQGWDITAAGSAFLTRFDLRAVDDPRNPP